MFRREKTIYIAAAPEAVFQYVADIGRHGEWGAQAWNITREPGPEEGPGTTFAASAHTGKGTLLEQAAGPWDGAVRWVSPHTPRLQG